VDSQVIVVTDPTSDLDQFAISLMAKARGPDIATAAPTAIFDAFNANQGPIPESDFARSVVERLEGPSAGQRHAKARDQQTRGNNGDPCGRRHSNPNPFGSTPHMT
jgi:hypothetical protein